MNDISRVGNLWPTQCSRGNEMKEQKRWVGDDKRGEGGSAHIILMMQSLNTREATTHLRHEPPI